MDSLFSRNLPKYPWMFVTGISVSFEQACNIIELTDSFFRPETLDLVRDSANGRRLKMPPTPSSANDWNADYANLKAWSDAWGYIQLEFIRTKWIDTDRWHRGEGWCAPTGRISLYNTVGKNPEIADIYSDWAKIAEAFPFLEVSATLEEPEDTYSHKIISFYIKNGIVTAIDPEKLDIHAHHIVNAYDNELPEKVADMYQIFEEKAKRLF